MESFEIRTHQRTEFVDLTDRVRQAAQAAGIRQGLCVVYCPHTTAAITINENADPDVVHHMLPWLNRAGPKQRPVFRHGEETALRTSSPACSARVRRSWCAQSQWLLT